MEKELTSNSQSLPWNTASALDAKARRDAVASLWPRFAAFVVDAFILYALGRGVGAVFFDTLSQLGPWGHLLGFFIALGYFATLDSSIGNGQTFGKRVLRVRVANAQGTPISLGKSVLRFTVFAIPQFLNGLQLPRAIISLDWIDFARRSRFWSWWFDALSPHL